MTKRDQQILFWTLAIASVAVAMGMVLSKAGSNQTLNAIAGTALMLYVGIAIVLIVLAILMPYFIYVCARELKRIRELLEQQERREKTRRDP